MRPVSVRMSPVGLVLVGIASVQFGAAIAKHLFDDVGPTGIVWVRLLAAALILTAVTRPRLRGRSRQDWQVMLSFGLTLALMNWSFYQAIARLPLGLAVAIEFLGPLLVAVAGSRRPRDLLWVLLAALGVGLLGIERADVTVAGVVYALIAAACWAGYILLSARTGQHWEGLDGLALAGVVATIVLTPAALASTGTALVDARILAMGLAIGVLSSVIPYSCELIALRNLRPSTFSILMSLEPGAAALAGVIVLGEFLRPLQWVAVVCVVIASIGATRAAAPPVTEPPPT